MKTALLSKVLRKKNKLLNIIAGQLLTFLFLIGLAASSLAQTAPALLDPTMVPQFTNPLPVIKDLGLRYDLTQGNTVKKNGKIKRLDVKMEETFQNLGLGINPATGAPYMTRVWGYKFPKKPITYPGATIVAMKNKPIDIRWKNNLPGHFLPVDASLHMAHPPGVDVATWYAAGNVPTVTHLHGGHTESASDGLPEAWFSQGFAEMGAYFVKQEYHYDNDQESATLWYHDHALGITRLNVYAGLAGFYLLRDQNELDKIADNTLPSGDYEIEIVIQDRMFDANGQLFWPAYPGDPAYADFIDVVGAVLPGDVFPGGGPTALAEFFGDVILVNGMAWPNLNVEPRKYRFRFLNGSDSRFYILKFSDDTKFMQIGTDNGLLDAAIEYDQLVFAPGERYDIVVDFTGKDGSFIELQNFGPDEPFKGFNPDGTISDGEGFSVPPANDATTGKIMQFSVSLPFNENVENATVDAGTTLRTPIVELPTDGSTKVQQLVLFEGSDEFGRLQPLLGTVADGSLAWFEPITEKPVMNTTEIWEVYNATADAHPIHLHLVSFQIINRESFDGVVTPRPQIQHNSILNDFTTYGIGGDFTLGPLGGDITGPEPNEDGWKDTFIVPPGKVGRVKAKFDRLGRYVWHCHILSHEDHEMMRPFEVVHVGGARIASNDGRIIENFPNPFQSSTQIRFELKKDQNIDFTVFDMQGKMIYHNLDYYREGKNAIFWDGFDKDGKILQTGVYLYKLQGEGFEESNRLVIER